MAMGNGSALDHVAIVDSVNQMANWLDTAFVRATYKNSRHGSFEQSPALPREARVTVGIGIHQPGAYIDIEWWENGDYKYHYREKGLEFRFGREAANHDTSKPVRHFHPPNNLSRHEPSCLDENLTPEQVTLGVLLSWAAAVQHSDPSLLNSQR